MPIFRYFMFVGGAMLALLLAANYVLPSQPVEQAVAITSNDQPLIRIRSDRHLPDTSQPTIVPPVMQTAAVAPPKPAQTAASQALAEMSAKARVRETFAQFVPAPKPEAAKARKAEARLQPQQLRHKVARNRPSYAPPGQPMMLVAQQPHFGLFNTTW